MLLLLGPVLGADSQHVEPLISSTVTAVRQLACRPRSDAKGDIARAAGHIQMTL